MQEGNGIWIPAEIWVLDLPPLHRVFLARLAALSKQEGASWAGDDFLAESLRCTPQHVRKMRRQLEDSGHIVTEGYGHKRRLTVELAPTGAKVAPTGTSNQRRKQPEAQELQPEAQKLQPEMRQEATTVAESIEENRISKEVSKSIEAPPKKEATPKDLQTVIDAFVEAGQTSDMGEAFFNYYESIGWRVGKARTPMKDWKASARGWIQRETKYQDESANNGWNKSRKRNGSYFHSSGKYKHPSDVLKDRDIWG
jgi:predicted transcriptional regulator